MTAETDDSPSRFTKKRYTPRTFAAGTVQFVHNLPRLVRAKRADRVSDQFAEKIMLAVTAVNECQYCTRYHTDLAESTGVDEETIDRILESDIDGAVADAERTALLFAQAYAEADEDPDPEAVAELRTEYGPETAADVTAFVRAIYFGNLLGNSYDALKFGARQYARRGRRCLRRTAESTRRAIERLRERCPV
ncbi:carboxymuconolactone decarboxylase family protein [Halobellus sp. Atlit-31R]|nr:carboxymuconolactone decarboxylase family protein [Halobellus sp. Atlit-31R]